MANWNFDVKLIPHAISQGLSLVRTDTDELISFVTRQYELIKHKDVIQMFEKEFKQKGIQVIKRDILMYGTLDSSMSVVYRLDVPMIIYKDNYMLIIKINNSYDRQSKLSGELGLWRQICENGAFGFKKEYGFNVRHIGNAGEHLEILLDRKEEFIKKALEVFKRMKKFKPVNEPILVTKKEYEKIRTLFEEVYKPELGNNMFAEFQSYTDFITKDTFGNKKQRYESEILNKFIFIMTMLEEA